MSAVSGFVAGAEHPAIRTTATKILTIVTRGGIVIPPYIAREYLMNFLKNTLKDL